MDEELVLDADGWPDPWPAVIELAWAVDSAHWALIGGLMVQLHCRLRGVEPHRATRDIDAMTRVETTWWGSLDHLLTCSPAHRPAGDRL